jgi:hypothetical protein
MYLLIASIAPAIFIMFIVYKYDTIKEPLSMLVKAFFGGVLSRYHFDNRLPYSRHKIGFWCYAIFF